MEYEKHANQKYGTPSAGNEPTRQEGWRAWRDYKGQLVLLLSTPERLPVVVGTVDHMSEGMTKEAVAGRLEQHGEAFAGFIGDVQANVLNSISAQSVGPEGFVENFQGMDVPVDLSRALCASSRLIQVVRVRSCHDVREHFAKACPPIILVASKSYRRSDTGAERLHTCAKLDTWHNHYVLLLLSWAYWKRRMPFTLHPSLHTRASLSCCVFRMYQHSPLLLTGMNDGSRG